MTIEAIDPVRIVLADDHELVRSGLRRLIEELPGLRVVAEVGGGPAAADAAAEHQPDLLIIDVQPAGGEGVAALAAIREAGGESPILALSDFESAEEVVEALRAGANACLLKRAAPEELALAIGALLAGESYLCPRIAGTIADYLRSAPAVAANDVPQLTQRQHQVLERIANGRSTREIAAELGIGPKTVETHRLRLMKRLDIHDLPQLVRYALRHGIASLDDEAVVTVDGQPA